MDLQAVRRLFSSRADSAIPLVTTDVGTHNASVYRFRPKNGLPTLCQYAKAGSTAMAGAEGKHPVYLFRQGR